MMRVAVIDNSISPEAVYELAGRRILGYEVHNGSCQPSVTEGFSRSHGTVCAALAAEFAPEAELLGISVGQGEDFSVANVCLALDWCLQNGAACICMSIGTTNWLGARQLAESTRELAERGVKLFCAVTPSGCLTFPACYPWAVGVSLDESVDCDGSTTGIVCSPASRRGCFLRVGHFSSAVLDRLCRENSFFQTRTSSMAVPFAAGYYLREGGLSGLPSQRETPLSGENILAAVEGWKIPVVRVRGGAQGMARAWALLEKFQQDGYMTALASHCRETDWSRLVVRVETLSDLAEAMTALGEASLVLLECSGERAFSGQVWDFEIDLSVYSVGEACEKIRTRFSSES